MNRLGSVLSAAVAAAALLFASCAGAPKSAEKPSAAISPVPQPVSQPAAQPAVAVPAPEAATVPAAQAVWFFEGAWNGTFTLGEESLEATLRFFEDEIGKAGALMDVPSQNLHGYPLGEVAAAADEVRFSLPLGEKPFAVTLRRSADAAEGAFGDDAKGKASFVRAPAEVSKSSTSHPFALASEKGRVRGQVDIPRNAAARLPVVLILAAAGSTDRDGNLLSAPGRGDIYKQLASQLNDRGIAAARYDKRGVGMSYLTVKAESDLAFADYIADARSAIAELKKDGRFSPIVVLGHGEGALIGAVAARQEGASRFIAVSPQPQAVDALLLSQAKDYPSEVVDQVKTMLEKIKDGQPLGELPEFLASFFRPGVLPYWKSWLAFDPVVEFRKLSVPALVVRGANDLQTPESDARTVSESIPKAKLLEIPGMNYAMKEIPADQQANIASYADASVPLSAAFVEAVVQFIKAE